MPCWPGRAVVAGPISWLPAVCACGWVHLAARHPHACLLPSPHRDASSTARDATLKRTPLHNAALADAADLAGLLLRHGADVAAVDARGATPVDLAVGALRGGTCSTAHECRRPRRPTAAPPLTVLPPPRPLAQSTSVLWCCASSAPEPPQAAISQRWPGGACLPLGACAVAVLCVRASCTLAHRSSQAL